MNIVINKCAVMAVTYVLLSFGMLICALANVEKNNHDEIDHVIDMLLNGEYDNEEMKSNENIDKQDHEEAVDVVPMLYPDGIWKCGDCRNMENMKLLYSEVYDRDVNYDDYEEDVYMKMQIGLSLSNMRCITMESEEDNMDVWIVSGACSGDQVTISVIRASHFVISVYG
ncbi:uncharacterized protein LOC123869319 [Maniola jurtina]|uniref:uncharacterized protein LOC123869319 n=1 Tax=Maniola jurtina TaxID=191418 RepID=UPI001E6879B5|nr:uncharacterized protein LOC123869319 [Maniola jurtina]